MGQGLPLGQAPAEWKPASDLLSISGGAHLGVFGDDKEMTCFFCDMPEVNEYQTKAKGFKVIEKKEYVRLQRLGDKLQIYFGRAEPRHIARFPREYQAFKSGEDKRVWGIPLENWDYQLSHTEIATFKLLGVEYVQQIAAMNEHQMLSLGPDAKNLVARAKITIEDINKKEDEIQKQTVIDSQNQKISDLESRLEALMARKSGEAKGEVEAMEREFAKEAAKVKKKEKDT